MQDLNTRKRSKLIFDLVVQIDFVFSHYYKIQFHINRFLTTVEFHQTACSDHKNPLLFNLHGHEVHHGMIGFTETKGVFVRVAAAGLASLTGPGLIRPGHGRPPSGVCLPALGEPGSVELLFATQC
jgi:hypothetical protein